MDTNLTVLITLGTALIAALATIYGVKKTSKTDRDKLVKEWASVINEYGQNVTNELDKIKATEYELREKLINTRDEYASAKIEHRKALAEKDNIIREKEQVIREKELVIREGVIQLHETQALLTDTRMVLVHTRHELIAARALIQVQSSYIDEKREEAGHDGNI